MGHVLPLPQLRTTFLASLVLNNSFSINFSIALLSTFYINLKLLRSINRSKCYSPNFFHPCFAQHPFVEWT